VAVLALQVAAGADDAREADDGSAFNRTAVNVANDAHLNAATRYNAGLRFTLPIAQGRTIYSATLQVLVTDDGGKAPIVYDDPLVDIHCEDVDNADNFITTADVTSRVRTTASTLWDDTNTGVGWQTSPDFTTSVQEVVDRESWVSGNALCVLMDGRDTANRLFRYRSYEFGAASAPKLDIVYSESTAGDQETINGVGTLTAGAATSPFRVGQVLVALKTRLETISGLQVFDYLPSRLNPPAAILIVGGGRYHTAFEDTEDMGVSVLLVTSKANDRQGQDDLTDQLTVTAVKAALEATPFPLSITGIRTGGFDRLSVVDLGGTSYYAIRFPVEVLS